MLPALDIPRIPSSRVTAAFFNEDLTNTDVDGERSLQGQLRPKLGFHYRISIIKTPQGYVGHMARDGQGYVAPPYEVQGKTLSELTRSCWEVLTEGYQLKADAARRTGDQTMVAALTLEHRRERQNLMADLERAFRVMPSGPRFQWNRPWENAPKEGSDGNPEAPNH